MAEVINMPRLSDTMEEGTVAAWLKKVGDTVKEGDILAEIETDKATMEFESFYEGTLLHIAIKEGESAKVDSLLAIVGKKGEDISGLIKGEDSSNKKESRDKNQEENKEKREESKEDSSDEDNVSENDESSEKEDNSEVNTSEEKDSEEKSDKEEQDSRLRGNIPEGVEIITMPRLSDTMTEGTVATWLKKEGDTVKEGDILAEIETDKATMEFESFYSGTLLKIGIKEGGSAPVDAMLAVIGPKGTDVSGILDGNGAVKKENKDEKESRAKNQEPRGENKENREETKENSEESKVETGKKEKEETTSNVTSKSSASSDARIFASPLAKVLAEEKGISLKQIKGSGENGRIVKSDVENYQPGMDGTAYIPVGKERFEEIKNSQMRKIIAKRLMESQFSAPHFYLTVELDMANVIEARTAINSTGEGKISFNDIIIKACAMALRKHPRVNSQWTEEVTKIAKHIHIGVAVAVEDGLLVPVIKFADQLNFAQIGAKVNELAAKARTKKISPQEMEGSTFTVSNLGMFGIQEFTSIINKPNSAILSVGAIVEKPVVKNGQLAVGNTMSVTLACDHRTVDGATGAQFLQTLRLYLENPVMMFL